MLHILNQHLACVLENGVPTECPSSTFSTSHASLSSSARKSPVMFTATQLINALYNSLQCRLTRGSYCIATTTTHTTSPNAISVSTTDEIWRRKFNLAPFQEHREGTNRMHMLSPLLKRGSRTFPNFLTPLTTSLWLLDTITSTVV